MLGGDKMENYVVNLSIKDTLWSNCVCRTNIITSTSTVNSWPNCLQCNYILNIINVKDTYFTVLIQNCQNLIIRNVYTSYPLRLLIKNNSSTQIITISGCITKK